MFPEELEWVEGSWRNKGYWRKKPYTRKNPTPAQRRIIYNFSKVAHEQGLNQWGTVELEDGKVIPASAVPIKEACKPVTLPKPPRIMFTFRALELAYIRKLIEEAKAEITSVPT